VFKVIITEVLDRIPDYQITAEQVTRFPKQDMLGGYQTMPATFAPGKRSS
jgi:hypothetical protein